MLALQLGLQQERRVCVVMCIEENQFWRNMWYYLILFVGIVQCT